MSKRPSCNGSSRALRALTSSALALPGVAGSAAADGPIERPRFDFNYSSYVEDDLDKDDFAGLGSKNRYEVDMFQFHGAAPWNEDTDFSLDIAYETMSGASPWFVAPDPSDDDKPKQAMSGATIDDARLDISLNTNFYRENGKNFMSAGISNEDDYLAFNGSVGLERHIHDKHTTLSGGAGFSVDEIDPVDDGEFATRVQGKKYKHSYTAFAGVSRILGRNSVVQSSLSYQHARGFLDDPYKMFVVGLDLEPDSRPGGRHQVSWLTRLRRHSPRLRGTLHLDYRLYWDNWDVMSHTADVAWYQGLPWYGIQLVPSVRYYSQSEAKFYAPFLESTPSVENYSNDYRLSNYGALAFRAKALGVVPIYGRDFELSVSYERYMSDANFAMTSSNFRDSPGLVSWQLWSIGGKLVW